MAAGAAGLVLGAQRLPLAPLTPPRTAPYLCPCGDPVGILGVTILTDCGDNRL